MLLNSNDRIIVLANNIPNISILVRNLLKAGLFFFILISFSACQTSSDYSGSKLISEYQGVFVLAGQSFPSTRRYYDSSVLPRPQGFSDYISYDEGAAYKSYAPDGPKYFALNEGLSNPTNWGAGVQCVECNLMFDDTHNAIINIGLYLAGPQYENGQMCKGKADCNLARVARGEFDSGLAELAVWAKRRSHHRILLRIGYEFDGAWNAYDPKQYQEAFKYIRRFLTDSGVSNIEYVFHSFGFASMETLEQYFPNGDEHSTRYVDWMGYSYFSNKPNVVGKHELELSRLLQLPVFIGELAPHSGDCTKQIDITKDIETAKSWIDNLVAHVRENQDVIKGIAYINENWADKEYAPMWDDQNDHNCGGFFSRSNSNLSSSPEIEKYWAEAISTEPFK